MVLPDIHLETKQIVTQTSADGVSDRHYLECRLMSFVLDFLFFYPFVSLLSHLYSGSLLFRLCLSLLTLSFLKTLSLIFWHFTPGQSLMKLKMISHEKSFLPVRYFVREILVSLSLLCVCVPLLSIFKNNRRQHYIDHLLGLSVSLQNNEKNELVFQSYSTQFLKSLSRLQVVLSLSSLFVMVSLGHQTLKKNQDNQASVDVCKVTGVTDLKSYVFLYLNSQVDEDCLAYQSVFNLNTGQGYWKFIASYITDKNEADKNKHIDRACAIYPKSALCLHFEENKRQPASVESGESVDKLINDLVSKDMLRF